MGTKLAELEPKVIGVQRELNTGEKCWETRGMSTIERLEFRTIRITESTCWAFDGHHDRDGYATFCVNGRTRQAYRVFYEQVRGPVPEGKLLDHKCRNRWCVNPGHLEPETPLGNQQNSDVTTHAIARSGICKKGHRDFFLYPSGRRACRTCQREQWLRKRAKGIVRRVA